jgi:hypothetical protein
VKPIIIAVFLLFSLGLGGCASGELSAAKDSSEIGSAPASTQSPPDLSSAPVESPKPELTPEQKNIAIQAYNENQVQKLLDLCSSGNSLACQGKEALDAFRVNPNPEANAKLCESNGNYFACKLQEVFAAASAGDAKKMYDLCSSGDNSFACGFVQMKGAQCAQKTAVACTWVAAFEKMKAPTEADGNSQYFKYVSLACSYGDKDACSEQVKLEEEQSRQALVNKVNEQTKCGMTQAAITFALGIPDAAVSCSDNLYTAVRYGTRWIFFKSDGAFAIIKHDQYAGACWDNWQYNNVTYRNPCKGN